ncbi:MAG: (d)CMP kinase [Tepidanaerobacteraceae bacterium]|nr:(d)CMP kinase [Tepidanaerobacter sp.]HQA60014.1 (d)CMP kinase [Tepidanaerobacteraceae bacterium]HQE04870.1 (d)CMP kinase [Tepidanaerobacteraceae bacterium]
MDFNIAIDGPAGAGKSTVARIIAEKLNMTYIDTGAMYRAITLLAIRHNKRDVKDIIELANQAQIKLSKGSIYINDEDVSDAIRSVDVNSEVSKIARIPEIRLAMVQLQREMAKNKGVVMDGRDIGTTVLPDAKYKFYLTANVKERALRRHREMLAKGEKVTLEDIEKEIIRRDHQDTNRDLSPLKAAEDSIIIDTTDKTVQQVVEDIINIVKRGEGIVL